MKKYLIPLACSLGAAVFLGLGIIVGGSMPLHQGGTYVPNYTEDAVDGMPTSSAAVKMTYVLDLLSRRYVDTLNLSDLVEDALPVIVEELDPHSVYIPATELDEVNEQLEGSFSGVGIQFNIQRDTVMVIQVVAGGPSERAGLMPGDRIVSVDDSIFCGPGIGITNDRVLKTLRGPKGSNVRLGVRRATSPDVLTFDIVRGDIPVESVVAQYVEDGIGYVKIDNFGRNTMNEFFSALVSLKAHGAHSYLIDLRGNGGGYMEVCCQMVSEFLDENSLIVYTEGKDSPRNDIRAYHRGNFYNAPVVVMIDEWSASASEIFSGAIQDNDRGIIVGRRSFGKGLVQQQYDLYDGSALRLTIARYYTPSGRCIQKPYEMGDADDYRTDIVRRYEHGEFWSADSISLPDSLVYYTSQGRKVYAGGGIMPDVFVPGDTTHVTAYYNRCINLGVVYSFAFQYSDPRRDELAEYHDYDALLDYLKNQHLLQQFITFAAPRVGLPSADDLQRSGAEIERLIFAYVMRQSRDENFFYRQFNSGDVTYQQAMTLLREGRAWPEVD